MKHRLNILFFLLLTCYVGVVFTRSSSRRTNGRRETRFIQSEPLMVSASSYLSAPASSPSSGCFFDTASNLIKLLDTKVQKYSTICNLETQSEIKGVKDLLNISKQLGQLKAKLTLNPNYTPTTQDKAVFASTTFPALAALSSNAKLTLDDIDKALNTILKETWTSYASAQGYPVFMKEKAWILAQFGFAKEYLEHAYANELSECLPVIESVKDIVDLVVIDLNEEHPPLIQKEIANKVKIDPYGFDFGGYALAFWIKEDNSELVEPIKLIQGFLNNTEVLNFRLDCCRINHLVTIGTDDYQFYSSPNCTEYAFVLLSFEKDCDSYLLNAVIRLSHSNLRYNITTTKPIPAEYIENLQLSLTSSRVRNPTFFTHFKYSPEEELRILSLMSSSFFGIIDSARKECISLTTIPPEGDGICEYRSLDRFCQFCQKGSYLFRGNCYKRCPDGTFIFEELQCEICEKNCIRCKDEDTCEICKPPYGLYNGDCYEQCPPGTFYENGICVPCVEGCLHCLDAKTCGECNAELYLCNNECTETLPIGTYPVGEKECAYCRSECVSCKSFDICDYCQEGYYLFEERDCVYPCPASYRADPKTRTCTHCIEHCRYCSADNQCDVCDDGYHLLDGKLCVEECPSGHVPIKGVCVPCTDQLTCRVCDANNINKCNDCLEPLYILPNKTCGPDCGYYYYPDGNRVCKPCTHKDCMMCTTNKCIKCKPGTYLLNDIDCVYPCPDHYVEDGDVCSQCENPLCKKCSRDNKKICTSCYYPKYLLKEGECVEKECGDYFYQNGERCEHCIPGCLECNNGYTCTFCDTEEGYYMKDGICVLDCGVGYRKNPNGNCERCSVLNCGKCDESASTCDICVEPYFLYNNICYEPDCPSTSYLPPGSRICEPCPLDCEHCLDGEICQQCVPPKVLQGSVCKIDCDVMNYAEGGICKPCKNPRCKYCNVHPDACSECPEGYYFYKGDCYEICPEDTYIDGRNCLPCDKRCKTCSGSATNCLDCVYPYLYDPDGVEKCPIECPIGEVPINGVCTECLDKPHCARCAQDLKCCLVPREGFYLYDCNVVEKCPIGTYPFNNTCIDCIEGCETCNYINPDKCETCAEGYYLLNGVCVPYCPDGYIEIGRECKKCGTYCHKCKPENTMCCTTCPPGRFRQNCDCVEECWLGYYGLDGECHKCHDNNCAWCTDDGAKCKRCMDNYVLLDGKCVLAPCPDGYTNKDGMCYPCSVSNCKNCDATVTECSYCIKPYVKVNDHQCALTCPSGTFKQPIPNFPNYYHCANCPIYCKECINDLQCSWCVDGFALYEDKCVDICPYGYYKTLDNGKWKCKPCPFPNCGKCTETDCLECKQKYYLQDNAGQANDTDICYAECPKGTYTDYNRKMCLPCPIHCTACTDAKTCTECENDFVLTPEHICDTSCSAGTVEIEGKCVFCKACEHCKECEKDLVTCIKCKDSRKLKNQKCVEDCGDGYYHLDGVCYPCIDNCKQCDNGKTCKWCKDSYYLYENYCVRPCPEGFFPANGRCERCGNNCKECYNAEECKLCNEPYLLAKGECYQPPCPAGFYQRNLHECGFCSKYCLTCESPEKCIGCAEGYYLYNGYCVEICPNGTLPMNGHCVSCVDHCNICGTNINECIDCIDGYYLYDRYCVEHCPPFYYPDGKVCKRCKSFCMECTDAMTCTKCNITHYLYDDDCVAECPNGYSPFDGVCVKCTVDECYRCHKNKDKCDGCKQGYFLYNNQCVKTCPDGTYTDYKEGKCFDCKKECKTCDNSETCLTCIDKFVYHYGQCYDDCPEGYAPVDGVCVPCQVDRCDTCNPDNLKECVICDEPLYVKEYKGIYTCVPECGNYFYPTPGRCMPCENDCMHCTDDVTCTGCVPPKVLYDASCYDECPKYHVVTSPGNVCKKCEQKGCLNCFSKDLSHCTHCELPYKLLDNKCVDICPIGFYEVKYADRAECLPCPGNCETCQNQEICGKCLPGYTLFEGHCIVPPCPYGFVDVNGYCQMCTEHCLQCSPNDPGVCIGCGDGYYLWEDQTCRYPCGPGYVGIDGICVQCADRNCLSCPNTPNKCGPGGCKYPMVLLDGSCVDKCPDGYYELDNQCFKCADFKYCRECYPLQPDKCKRCYPEFPLYQYICQSSGVCPDGWFINSNNECQQCSPYCAYCNDIKKCIRCKPPYALDALGNCVTCKSSGQVQVDGECKNCTDPSCVICRANDLGYCEQCDTLKVNYQGKCFDECPVGTFIKGRTCVECEANCDKCFDAQTCLECSEGFVEYKYDCIKECPAGYVDVDGHCVPCSARYCDKCDKTDLTKCIVCNKDYPILYESKCYATCPVRTYYDEEAKTCKPCINGCLKCLDGLTCESCDMMHWRYPNDKLCYEECPDTTFVNSTVLECYDCPGENCRYCCPNNPKLCLECLPGFLELYDNEGYRYCVSECPEGYYQNGTMCLRCQTNCKSCIDNKNCTICRDPYLLLEGKCIISEQGEGICPLGYVKIGKECFRCKQFPNCAICPHDDLSICEECFWPLILYGTECVTECPPHHFVHVEGNVARCIPCPDGCKRCNKNQCLECLDGLYFYQYSNDCVQCKLPSQPIGEKCMECSVEGCEFCVDGEPYQCRICKEGFFLFNQTCVPDCPDGYYEDGIICRKCMGFCGKCQSKDKCDFCEPPHVLLEGICVDKCPEHYRVNGRVCERCQNPYCLHCDENAEKCTKCERIGYGPYYLYEHQCRYDCPVGTGIFEDKCVECPKDCTRCYGSVCDECVNGKYLHDDKCIAPCPPQFYVRDSRYCTRCAEDDCLSCPDNICIECMDGSFLNETTHTCGKCAEGYYGNPKTKKCEPCAVGCKHCIDENTCLKCYEPYAFFEEVCVDPCPDGYTELDGRCVPCTSQDCIRCQRFNPDTCLWCANGFKHKGYCLPTCPIGFYNSTLNGHKVCEPCDSRCDVCLNKGYCIDCKDNFVLLPNNTCGTICPNYYTRVGENCERCLQDPCISCALDLEMCYECEDGYYLHDHKCIRECPHGTYADHIKHKCLPCDETCESCITESTCTLCKHGYYNHSNICVSKCPDGFFANCTDCSVCPSECKTCYSADYCYECHDGYFMKDRMCRAITTCERGEFFNGTQCERCGVKYCAHCTSRNTCDECNRGFRAEDGKCVQAQTLTTMIDDFITVDPFTSGNKDIRPHEQLSSSAYQSVGVGSPAVTYSFFLRLLQPTLDRDLTILTTRNPTGSAYNMKFILDKQDTKCKVIITDEADLVYEVPLCDCSYNSLYDWKFFVITLLKHGHNFVAKANVIDDQNQLIEKSIHVDANAHTEVLDSASSVILNEYDKDPSNAAFQIGKLNVMDYYPSEEQIISLYSYKPSTCDYFCTTCNDICLTCPDGVIPTNNRCPAMRLNNKEDTLLERPVHLREYLNDKLTSDAYGFTEWLYINEAPRETPYTIYKVEFAGYKNASPYINVQIINGRIVFNGEVIEHEVFKAKQWYFIVFKFMKGDVNVTIRGTNGYVYTYTVKQFVFVRQYEDFVYYSHIDESTSSPYVTAVLKRNIYLNNIPSDSDIEFDYGEHKCTANCEKCDEDMKCLICLEGYVVEDGKCVENSPKEDSYVELVNIHDLWNNDYKSYDVPFKENLTIAFNIRKKTHSNIYKEYKKYNLLSYSNGYSTKPLITETFVSEFVSEYTVISEDGNKAWRHDYNDEVTDYITILILVNKYSETISFYVNDFSIETKVQFSGEFDDVISKLIIGDSKGYEMNTEITNLRVFDGLAGETLKDKLLKRPNACVGNCEKCDYTTGLCATCAFDSKVMAPRLCGKVSYSWYPAYLFGYNDWTFTSNHKFYVKNYHTNGVNAVTYSLYGLFQMFRLVEGARYRVTCINNDELKVFRPEKNRGSEVLCLDVLVQEGDATLILRVLDGLDYIQLPIKNFAFVNKDWVSMNVNVDVVEMLLRYDFMKNNNETTIVHGEYTYKHVPEKIQKSSSISVHGANDNIDKKVYSVPHINDYQIALIPHDIYNSSSVLKTKALLVQPDCGEGCDACVWDVARTKGLCFECMQGYDKKYVSSGSAQLTCTKSKDKSIVFKGEIEYNTNEYVVPRDLQNAEQWSVYFQILFNFGFWKYTSNTNVLTAGDGIKVAVLKGKLYVIVGDKDTAEIPLHDQYNTWNHVMLSKIGSQLKITVNAGSYEKEIAIKSTALSTMSISTIKVRPVGYFVSFYATSYTTSANIDFIKQAEPLGIEKCGVDCAYCEKGTCKVCGNGYNADGTCKNKKMILMPGYYAPDNGVLTLKYLVDTDLLARFIRIKNWTYQFTIEYDKMLSTDTNFFTFLNYNGIDSITSTLNMQNGVLDMKLWPVSTYESNTYEQVKVQLPRAPKNPFFFVGISFDSTTNEFRVVFAENASNYVEKTYKLKAFLGYFGIETSALMYGTVYASIADIMFDYNHAATVDELKVEMNKYTKPIQKDCSNGTPTKCIACSTGTISNGLCVPPNTSTSLITQFREYYQINPYSNNKSYKTSMPALDSFTLMFMFRLNSLSKGKINLLKMNSSAMKDILTIDYNAEMDTMTLSFYQIYQRINAGPIYKKNGNALEWVTFAMAYDIVKGKLTVKIVDTEDNLLFKGNSNLPTGTKYASSTYIFNIGYSEVLTGSFEFTALEFFDHLLSEDEISKFMFNSLRKTKHGCKSIVNGVCNSKIDNEIVMTTKAQTTKSAELFSTLYETDKFYSFDNYLITLEVDIATFNKGTYTANPSTLFLFTEEITDETISLDKAQPIPKSTMNSGLSMSLDGNSLIIRAPNLPWNTNEQQTFVLRFSDSSFKSNVMISLLGDAETNTLSLLVHYDGNSYFYDVTYNDTQKVPLIGFGTLVYGHPSLKYFSINFNSPRLDYNALRYGKNLKNSCIVGMKGTYCPKCLNGFNLFRPICKNAKLDQSTLHDQ